jgi:hypothetical protein
MNREEFYSKCAELLLPEYTYNKNIPNKTRWNGRLSGNGCFANRGIIMDFGTAISVRLRNPYLRGIYATREEALAEISKAVNIFALE